MPRLKEKFHPVHISNHAFVQNELLASKVDLLSETTVLTQSGPSPGILASAHARSKHTQQKSFTFRQVNLVDKPDPRTEVIMLSNSPSRLKTVHNAIKAEFNRRSIHT